MTLRELYQEIEGITGGGDEMSLDVLLFSGWSQLSVQARRPNGKRAVLAVSDSVEGLLVKLRGGQTSPDDLEV